MKTRGFKKQILIALMITVYLVLGGFPAAAGQPDRATADPGNDDGPQFIAYYFYTSKRCSSCYRLEKWSENTIKDHFKQAIESGKLQWKTVNVDKSENKHFTKDFNLYTKSLVIVEQNDGETVRWKNLEKVWQLLQDKEEYADYVSDEIRAFMEKS